MADIIQEFTVRTGLPRVFHAMATPQGLTHWWTQSSSGKPEEGAEYQLHFGPDYAWRARVTRYEPDVAFELEMTEAHPDWMNTRVGCVLKPEGRESTRVRFYHTGWPGENQHWRVSCYCWAMYLRIMRRYLEHGESVSYERRLDA
ncbi:MAG TPA: SRPBCC domain-containing protein [Steroidobacteraceae bacterium]|nr:SRPBCC domain-containing protein [Steroidobacteraceae bacterium]